MNTFKPGPKPKFMANDHGNMMEAIFDESKHSTAEVSENVVEQFKRYQKELGRLSDQGVNISTETVDKEFESLKTIAERLKELKDNHSEATDDFIKKMYADDIKRTELEVKRASAKATRELKKIMTTDKAAMKAMEVDSKKFMQTLDKQAKSEFDSLKSAITKAKKQGAGHTFDWVSHSGHGFEGKTVEEAQELLIKYRDQYESLKKEYAHALEDVVLKHSNVKDEYKYVADLVKDHTGHDILGAASAEVHATETSMLRGAEDIAKGGGGFKKVLTTGLGAAIGAFVGHQFDKEDSNVGTVVGAGAGGVAGFMVGNKMLAQAAGQAIMRH